MSFNLILKNFNDKQLIIKIKDTFNWFYYFMKSFILNKELQSIYSSVLYQDLISMFYLILVIVWIAN